MNPMTQMLAEQRINDMHRTGQQSRAAQQVKSTRSRHIRTAGRRTRRAQIATAR